MARDRLSYCRAAPRLGDTSITRWRPHANPAPPRDPQRGVRGPIAAVATKVCATSIDAITPRRASTSSPQHAVCSAPNPASQAVTGHLHSSDHGIGHTILLAPAAVSPAVCQLGYNMAAKSRGYRR
jgi:hypothetical protein